MAIRFAESDMRPIGRSAMGVKSIELDEGDEVVDMAAVEEGAQVLSITELGYGKRTDIEEYRRQNRGGKGIKAMNLTDKTGPLSAQMLVHPGQDILMITDDGTIIRTNVDNITVQGRNTQGVRIMRVQDARVVAICRAEPEEDDEETVEGESIESVETVNTEGMTAPTENPTGEPDALDRLMEDLEENPEPEI